MPTPHTAVQPAQGRRQTFCAYPAACDPPYHLHLSKFTRPLTIALYILYIYSLKKRDQSTSPMSSPSRQHRVRFTQCRMLCHYLINFASGRSSSGSIYPCSPRPSQPVPPPHHRMSLRVSSCPMRVALQTDFCHSITSLQQCYTAKLLRDHRTNLRMPSPKTLASLHRTLEADHGKDMGFEFDTAWVIH